MKIEISMCSAWMSDNKQSVYEFQLIEAISYNQT